MAAACFGGSFLKAVTRSELSTTTAGSADATQNGTDLLEPLPALAVDSRVDGDAVEPGFGGGIGPPRLPGLERAFESVLGAVLRGLAVAQHRDQSPQNPPVRVAIKALEVGL